ncbi:uncharacterized protein LOC62_01G001521 [Vanrija pseudolonga]|uniref:Extracellular membrane protein CFEM domain-containing protein n=1 Tax=Vanrija pseudolonga TaxID=143232 RepID=A0AAF1BJ58_9TREE|nr:hypothetical protein LOC62_01G001521 [Vanrija pseudolonga]
MLSILLLAVLAARTVSAATFVVCTSTFAGTPTFKPAANNEACLSACGGFQWSYYAPGQCVCSNTGPSNGLTTYTPNSYFYKVVVVPTDACPRGGYIASKLVTSFSYAYCADSIIPNILDTPNQNNDFTTVQTPDQCFAQCQAKNYALLWANSGKSEGWKCACLKYYPVILPLIVNCQNKARFLFQHAPQVSGAIARRNRKPLAIDGAEAYCPPGLEPCKVPEGGYECLDVSSELNSCGGCLNGSMVPSNNQTVGLEATA